VRKIDTDDGIVFCLRKSRLPIASFFGVKPNRCLALVVTASMIQQQPGLSFSFLISVRYVLLLGWTLTSFAGCRSSTSADGGQPMRLAVGEVKEVTVSGKVPIQSTSDNQEVVDVSQKPLSRSDSSALAQGNTVAMVFLIKGVTAGSARVLLSEPSSGNTTGSRLRKAYRVQVANP